MTDKERPKIVSLSSKRDEEKEQFKNDLIEVINDLVKAIKEDRLEDVVLQWNETTEGTPDADHVAMQTMIMHWNRANDIDQTLGFASRLMYRLNMIAESVLMGHE